MKPFIACCLLIVLIVLYGCGGGGGSAIDAPTVAVAPAVASKTTSSVGITPGTFTDSDGIQNVVIAVYDANRTTKIATAVDGQFTGLAAGTTYCFRMEGQAKNGISGVYEDKTSEWIDVVTQVAAPVTTMDDITNMVTLGGGVDAAAIEVSVDGAPYVPFDATTVYPGDHVVKVRVKAMNGITSGADAVFKFTANVVSAQTSPSILASEFASALNAVDSTSSTSVQLYTNETLRSYVSGQEKWFVVWDARYSEYKAISLQYIRSIVYNDYAPNNNADATEFRSIERGDILSGKFNGDTLGNNYEVVDKLLDGTYKGRNSSYLY